MKKSILIWVLLLTVGLGGDPVRAHDEMDRAFR